MALGLESSRHFPSAVALKIAENADGTRCVPATFDVHQVPLGVRQRREDATRRRSTKVPPGFQQSSLSQDVRESSGIRLDKIEPVGEIISVLRTYLNNDSQ